MGKVWVEICLISARGLRRSSLWKSQWFAVGWIDPDNKYCTKIDASGNVNPVWKTKFVLLVDDSNLEDMMLHVEVYSREPIFLGERLQGTAAVALREFLAKHDKNSEASTAGTEELGSYQLRKRNSSKTQGFVDVSIRIFEGKEESEASFPGDEGGIVLDYTNNAAFPTQGRGGLSYLPRTTQPSAAPFQRLDDLSKTNAEQSISHPTKYSNPSHGASTHSAETGSNLLSPGAPGYPAVGGPSYRPPRTPPPPPPPSHVGYIPTVLPGGDPSAETCFNMSSSSAAASGRGPRPGFAMGVGAGALAAGAVIFGDDFMSGFDIPGGLRDASLTISADPPF